jgi:hypothetical protein
MGTNETLVFLAVVGARFLVPLLIPLFPLPAILACLVLDAVDQSIFQAFGYDPPGYQGYDKAMDVYYLAMAYLATLRNWASVAAASVARFLYFYRLVGVVAFELSGVRALLLIFPNTFEYFFMAYEAVRSRWRTTRWGLRWWIGVAALIWIFVKLPQEWWIHVAQLDFTEFLDDHAWAAPTILVLLLLAGGAFWIWGRPRLVPADHRARYAADPLPEEMDTATEQAAAMAAHGAVWSAATLEKIVLLGLLAVIFAQTIPATDASELELFVGVGVLVVVNAALMLALARRSLTVRSTSLAFLARTVANVVLVWIAYLVLGGGDVAVAPALFLVTLISLLTTLHDRWQPVNALRAASSTA